MSAMSMIRRPAAALWVGADLGGTWVRVVAGHGSRPRRRLVLRSPSVHNREEFFRALWRRQRWRGRAVGALVVASRGIWTPAECRAFARPLRGLARRVRALPDAQAAFLGALGDRPGLLILSGTGSIVVGHDGRGHWARGGGLGPLLGDEGSGFWLGREWLRATVGANYLAVRALVTAPDPVARIAALAPAVIRRARRGDRRARAVVAAGQAHLAQAAQRVAGELRLSAPVAVSWAGSVLGGAWFRAGLRRALARRGVRARWRAPAREPVVAAGRLAESLSKGRRQ
jgi:N-acetylglucosamine kinase-like BadF-type ATPase